MQPQEKRAAARRQAIASMVSGAVAQPISGLAGLAGLLMGGAKKGAEYVDATQKALTYQPRDPSALNTLSRWVAPVTTKIESAKQGLGDRNFEATGSAGWATAAQVAPDLLLTALGARFGGGVKGTPLSEMVARSAGPGMGSRAAQIGSIGFRDAPDYGMAHRPVTLEGGAAQLHDLAPSFGDDIYTPNAVDYFGTGDLALDRQTVRVLNAVRGNPSALVSVYRAVPVDADAGGLSYGDWVTVNKAYAQRHGESALGGKYRIIEQRVPASHLTTNADSFHEQGYYPPK